MAERGTGETGLGADVTLSEVADRLAPHYLEVLGGFHAENDTALPPGSQTLLMIGPKEPGFWAHFTAQPEWDGGDNPMDRWSRRVIGRIACDIKAKALFPFGGPPYHPFYQWAVRTGRVWDSPVRLLVQASQGLLVSFRGALALPYKVELPATAAKPCDSCAKPCLTACPAGALGAAGYDVPACHAYLNQHPDGPCLNGGCLVRRACPVSEGYARLAEQSAYHMGRFHRAE